MLRWASNRPNVYMFIESPFKKRWQGHIIYVCIYIYTYMYIYLNPPLDHFLLIISIRPRIVSQTKNSWSQEFSMGTQIDQEHQKVTTQYPTKIYQAPGTPAPSFLQLSSHIRRACTKYFLMVPTGTAPACTVRDMREQRPTKSSIMGVANAPRFHAHVWCCCNASCSSSCQCTVKWHFGVKPNKHQPCLNQ